MRGRKWGNGGEEDFDVYVSVMCELINAVFLSLYNQSACCERCQRWSLVYCHDVTCACQLHSFEEMSPTHVT